MCLKQLQCALTMHMRNLPFQKNMTQHTPHQWRFGIVMQFFINAIWSCNLSFLISLLCWMIILFEKDRTLYGKYINTVHNTAKYAEYRQHTVYTHRIFRCRQLQVNDDDRTLYGRLRRIQSTIQQNTQNTVKIQHISTKIRILKGQNSPSFKNWNARLSIIYMIAVSILLAHSRLKCFSCVYLSIQ